MSFPSHIWLIDNHSSDDSVPQIQRYLHSRSTISNVSLVCLSENLGYAAGNNVGIAQALEEGAKYVWILNNDTWVAPDSLAILVDFMREHPEVVICGTSLLEAEKPDIVQTLGGRLSLVGTSGNLGPGRVWSSVPLKTIWPDYVVGASMLLRSDFVRKNGAFDSRLFLYCEDVEISLKARKNGYRLAVLPRARVWHKGGGSVGHRSPIMTYYEVRNRCLVARKYRPLGWWVVWGFAFLRAWQRRLCHISDLEDFGYRMRALQDARHDRSGPIAFSIPDQLKQGKEAK